MNLPSGDNVANSSLDFVLTRGIGFRSPSSGRAKMSPSSRITGYALNGGSPSTPSATPATSCACPPTSIRSMLPR